MTEPLRVETQVLLERGQWTVWLITISPTGVERRQLSTHRTQALAELAADVVRRTSARRRRSPEGPDDTPDA